MFNSIYKNKKILVTGHTGFKGSWLSLWLQDLGANVFGISLPPILETNHYKLLALDMESYFIDIRDTNKLKEKISQINPDCIFHLAAQPLVRKSYKSPLETWNTNVIGTANVLDACRNLENLSSVLAVTTDKCYENKNWVWGYRETDSLGGYDPYSSSKAASELLVSSYRSSFFNSLHSPLLASARAGNVIGGGDWSEDRLIPDLIRAIESNSKLKIRSPASTRPWQHVLDCLNGYLLLGEKLIEGDKNFACAWNFGPDQSSNRTVEELLNTCKKNWPKANWEFESTITPHEASLLQLDSSKARLELKWKPLWKFETTVKNTMYWYKNWVNDKILLSKDQLKLYQSSLQESLINQ